MKKNSFTVKTKDLVEYKQRLIEFSHILDTWKENKDGREYTIDHNENELKFNIIATESYGEN